MSTHGDSFIFIPEKFYIDFQPQSDEEVKNEDIPLGFATYYELEDKAFLKRKNTITDWARPRYRNAANKKNSEFNENNPISGFKVARSVKRYGWNGGNVVWRIEDPRGFELEIQSGNMAQILAECVIENGEIKGECVWGWNKKGGSRLTLIPTHTSLYKSAAYSTKIQKSSIKASDVNPGDIVVLSNKTKGIYLGKVQHISYGGADRYPVMPHVSWNVEYDASNLSGYKINCDTYHGILIKDNDEEKVYLIKSLKVSLKEGYTSIDVAAKLDEINAQAQKNDFPWSLYSFAGTSNYRTVAVLPEFDINNVEFTPTIVKQIDVKTITSDGYSWRYDSKLRGICLIKDDAKWKLITGVTAHKIRHFPFSREDLETPILTVYNIDHIELTQHKQVVVAGSPEQKFINNFDLYTFTITYNNKTYKLGD